MSAAGTRGILTDPDLIRRVEAVRTVAMQRIEDRKAGRLKPRGRWIVVGGQVVREDLGPGQPK